MFALAGMFGAPAISNGAMNTGMAPWGQAPQAIQMASPSQMPPMTNLTNDNDSNRNINWDNLNCDKSPQIQHAPMQPVGSNTFNQHSPMTGSSMPRSGMPTSTSNWSHPQMQGNYNYPGSQHMPMQGQNQYQNNQYRGQQQMPGNQFPGQNQNGYPGQYQYPGQQHMPGQNQYPNQYPGGRQSQPTSPQQHNGQTPQSNASFSQVELNVIADINAARAQNGLQPLVADPSLGNIAREHSADMLTNNYFDHVTPSGCAPDCRYENAGYAFSSAGENIYWMGGYNLSESDSAQKVVDTWQNSPGHRVNDLGNFTNVGVGVVESGGKVYVTADFSTPR